MDGGSVEVWPRDVYRLFRGHDEKEKDVKLSPVPQKQQSGLVYQTVLLKRKKAVFQTFLKDLLHVLQISSEVSLRLHIFIILGLNTFKLYYFFFKTFSHLRAKIKLFE